MSDNRSIQLQLAIAILGLSLLGPVYLFKQSPLSQDLLGVVGMAIGLGAYAFMLYLTPGTLRISPSFFWLTAIAIRIPVLAVPIFVDDTLYRAIWDGWIQHQGINPYHFYPSAERLDLLQTGDLYELLHHTGAYSATSPLWLVPYRFMSYIYNLAGLGGTILAFKIITLLLDIGVIKALLAWKKQSRHHIPAVALWALVLNPFLILYFTGQGLIFLLVFLIIIWTAITWQRRVYELASILWGALMLATPLAWLLYPYLFRAFGWKKALLALITVVVWWAPFFTFEAISNFSLGHLHLWMQPGTYLSAGHYLVTTLQQWSGIAELGVAWVALVWLVLFSAALGDAIRIRSGEFSVEALLNRLAFFGLLLFLLMPAGEYISAAIVLLATVMSGRLFKTAGLFTALLLVAVVLTKWNIIYIGLAALAPLLYLGWLMFEELVDAPEGIRG